MKSATCRIATIGLMMFPDYALAAQTMAAQTLPEIPEESMPALMGLVALIAARFRK